MKCFQKPNGNVALVLCRHPSAETAEDVIPHIAKSKRLGVVRI